MMRGGNVGRGNRGGDRKPPGKEKLQRSACDVSSDEFKKTWLTLKELHDKELYRLQTKLTNLRKERLADGRRTGSIAKIKELTEQQKILNRTIHDLRDQLKAKVCERCSVNETYRNTLQQELYDIQQQNIRFIADLTAERNNLREENRRLSAKLKLNEQPVCESSFNSEEDFIPCSQVAPSDYPGRELFQGTQAFVPVKLILESEQPKPKVRKEPRQSSEFPLPLCSQDLFEVPETTPEVPETPVEMPSSHSSKGSSGDPRPSTSLHLTSTLAAQRGGGILEESDRQEDSLDQPKRKHILTQKTCTQKVLMQKCKTTKAFSWSFSSLSGTENPPIQLLSETSEENMPVSTRSFFSSCIEKKEGSSSSGLLFDSSPKCSGKRRSRAGVAQHSPGFSVKDGSDQTPPTRQSTVKKLTGESTGVGNGAKMSQGEVQSRIKRKAKTQSKRRRK